MGGAMQSYHYRLRMGEYAFLKEVSALGVQAGRETSLGISGAKVFASPLGSILWF